MTTTAAPKSQTVTELKAAISKLTGRVPASNDPRYLVDRLRDLRERKESGENLKHKTSGDPPSIFSVSMPTSARSALDAIVKKEKVGISEIVRRALSYWGNSHGYRDEASVIGGDA